MHPTSPEQREFDTLAQEQGIAMPFTKEHAWIYHDGSCWFQARELATKAANGATTPEDWLASRMLLADRRRKAICDELDRLGPHWCFPSNLDMQKSLSRSLGTDLSWFFKQWVYGMGIPKLEFSYELATHPDGGTLLRGRIKQRQPGDPFRFPMAVYVRQGKGKSAEEAHFYQWVETGDATFEVGPLPWRPDEVTLNDDLGVLAIVEPVDWKGAASGL